MSATHWVKMDLCEVYIRTRVPRELRELLVVRQDPANRCQGVEIMPEVPEFRCTTFENEVHRRAGSITLVAQRAFLPSRHRWQLPG